ncbi:MAG: protein-glutamate O-methyltransferase CheR [candidate division KSB1 bacterium]|nr:protein-glutamate O-methyltransferase CheR [candidate division KSB1 bacterium]
MNCFGLTVADLNYIRSFIHKKAGIVLSQDKDYLVESRLAEVARVLGQPTLSTLIHLLKNRPTHQLEVMVVDALTTNETLWFRDKRPFLALQKQILPQIHKTKTERKLTIWSAACSTGQEPYSLAMLILDLHIFHQWDTTIYATDISQKVIQKAKTGIYSQFEINRGLPAKYLIQYFRQIDKDQWVLKEPVKRLVRFSQHNLLNDPPPVYQVDLILCRNVLIYFDVEARTHILQQLYKALAPEGFLMLGASESTLGLTDQFIAQQYDSSIFYKPVTKHGFKDHRASSMALAK